MRPGGGGRVRERPTGARLSQHRATQICRRSPACRVAVAWQPWRTAASPAACATSVSSSTPPAAVAHLAIGPASRSGISHPGQAGHLDELHDAAVGDVELPVEVERARVGIAPVFGDLPVIDVARQLGRVLVLLVLGLERAQADALALGEREAAHAHVLDHARPVAAVQGQQAVVPEAADRIELAVESIGKSFKPVERRPVVI